jgi:hypothetical protein
MATKKTESPSVGPAVMYVGPTKMGALHVTRGSVFKGGVLPGHLSAAVQAKGNESFKALFVPVAEAGRARAELRDGRSALAQAYHFVQRQKG